MAIGFFLNPNRADVLFMFLSIIILWKVSSGEAFTSLIYS